ncbi:MAG: restriction endonuclease [Candidatus Thermoplasmatota archaeon]|jgi:predicted RecB family endonuclease|nr:restriction endonuclease [Candidatus Thermoplasmatota archaeon]
MSKARGESSERIAKRLLENKGFRVLSTKHLIKDHGEKVAEVDIIAESPSGEQYAVEVKSGKADVNSLRQAYANSKLCGCKPMLICKGYADESAKKVAKRLNVNVVELSEYYLLLEPEELESIVKKCVEEVFETHGFLPFSVEITKKDKRILQAIATAKDFDIVSNKLKVTRKDLGKMIDDLKTRGIIPSRSLSFQDLKLCCSSIIARHEIFEKLKTIEKRLK